jgi:hypothetical protein
MANLWMYPALIVTILHAPVAIIIFKSKEMLLSYLGYHYLERIKVFYKTPLD